MLRLKHEQELEALKAKQAEKEAKRQQLLQEQERENQRRQSQSQATAAAGFTNTDGKSAQSSASGPRRQSTRPVSRAYRGGDPQSSAQSPGVDGSGHDSGRSSSPPIPTLAGSRRASQQQDSRPPSQQGKASVEEKADSDLQSKRPQKPSGSAQNHGAANRRRASRASAEGGRRTWTMPEEPEVALPEVLTSTGLLAAAASTTSESGTNASANATTTTPFSGLLPPDFPIQAPVSPPVPAVRRQLEQGAVESRENMGSGSKPSRATSANAEQSAAMAKVPSAKLAAPAAAPTSVAARGAGADNVLNTLAKIKQRLLARQQQLALEVEQGEQLLQHSGKVFAVNEMSRLQASISKDQ